MLLLLLLGVMILLVVLCRSKSTTSTHVKTGLRMEWFLVLIGEVWYFPEDIIETATLVLSARIVLLP